MRRNINISITIENDEVVDVKIGGISSVDADKVRKANTNDHKVIDQSIRLFWETFRTQFQWDVVPYSFIFAVFSKWYVKYYRKDSDIKYKEFGDFLHALILQGDDIWTCQKNKNDKIRVTKDSMNKPEPLILTYLLEDWMSTTFKGDGNGNLCIPDPILFARGIKRIKRRKR